MITFECPNCWAVLEVKNRRRPGRCPKCGHIIAPDDMEDTRDEANPFYIKRRGDSPHRRAWKRWLWGTFWACAAGAVVLTVLLAYSPKYHTATVGYSVAVFIVSVVMLVSVLNGYQEKMAPPSTATAVAVGVAGGLVGALMYAFLRYSCRWPQPLLTGLLAFGTLMGTAALDRRGAAPADRDAARWGDPPDTEPPPPPFVKPKVPPPATALPGLTAYWAFDEGAGEKAVESVTKTADGSGRWRWTTGARGGAIELDGRSTVFYPGSTSGLDVKAKAPFTFALWVRTDEKVGTVLAFRSLPDGLALLHIWVEGGKPRAWVRHNGGVFAPPALTGPALVPGEWHHLAFMRHGNGSTELFVDGASADKKPAGSEGTGTLVTNGRALGLEPMDPKSRDRPLFAGGIDEFCAFDRALTAAEVAKLAGRGP